MDYDLIDKLLAEKHMSRRKLAELAGISVNTLSAAFRRKTKNISIDSVMRIADVLQVNWWELMGYEDYGGGVYGVEASPDQDIYKKVKGALNRNLHDRINDSFGLQVIEGTLPDYLQIRELMDNLNPEGREEAVKRISELTELPRYKRQDNPNEDKP